MPDGAPAGPFRFGRDAISGNRSPESVLVYRNPIVGASRLHLGGAGVADYPVGRPEELPRQVHVGGGFRFGVEAGESGGLTDGRFLSLEVLLGWERGKDLSSGDAVEREGIEFRLFRAFSYRWGRVDDPEAGIQEDTRGYGIALEEFLPFGFRYDYAEAPRAVDIPAVARHAFSLSVDTDRLFGR
ncbi:MAG: hypothetical protein JW958_13480 [Candidatus Eisenbacteria bacterium]|nr:hypothetical protein [Candidatus Eisenbacteria bacterium]